MARIIPIKDLKDTTAISQMCDVYAKLAEAEHEIRDGRLLNARDALQELRAKYVDEITVTHLPNENANQSAFSDPRFSALIVSYLLLLKDMNRLT